MLICVMAVWNEAEMIQRAVISAFDAGCDSVHVFDGGWDGFGSSASTDGTRELAAEVGAAVHMAFASTQAGKRTGMFHQCGAGPGDHVFSLDADETVEGVFPQLTPVHHNVTFQNLAENELPGIRRDWPDGDGGLEPFPLLRVFAYSPDLCCVSDSSWYQGSRWIEPYTADGKSKLPVVPGVRLLHHAHERSRQRIEAKADFYRVEHKRRGH